jgi:hypothetical protein
MHPAEIIDDLCRPMESYALASAVISINVIIGDRHPGGAVDVRRICGGDYRGISTRGNVMMGRVVSIVDSINFIIIILFLTILFIGIVNLFIYGRI